eukprot:TRINITY_DN18413_c0_g1_i1.p1 TRINITY_DN18413_c0_g1~~TRINITY_DN18413_c0_g1_i1.p1  ORF type:complete len:598 (+),score=128.82 TRINITY_DN18413_c0_g1_i1:143-1936(+)
MEVQFIVRAHTDHGDRVLLSSSSGEQFDLTTTRETYPQWVCDLHLNPELLFPFKYKYVRVSRQGQHIESSTPRQLHEREARCGIKHDGDFRGEISCPGWIMAELEDAKTEIFAKVQHMLKVHKEGADKQRWFSWRTSPLQHSEQNEIQSLQLDVEKLRKSLEDRSVQSQVEDLQSFTNREIRALRSEFADLRERVTAHIDGIELQPHACPCPQDAATTSMVLEDLQVCIDKHRNFVEDEVKALRDKLEVEVRSALQHAAEEVKDLRCYMQDHRRSAHLELNALRCEIEDELAKMEQHAATLKELDAHVQACTKGSYSSTVQDVYELRCQLEGLINSTNWQNDTISKDLESLRTCMENHRKNGEREIRALRFEFADFQERVAAPGNFGKLCSSCSRQQEPAKEHDLLSEHLESQGHIGLDHAQQQFVSKACMLRQKEEELNDTGLTAGSREESRDAPFSQSECTLAPTATFTSTKSGCSSIPADPFKAFMEQAVRQEHHARNVPPPALQPKRDSPFFTLPRHPEDDRSRNITLQVEKEVLESLRRGDPAENKRKIIKKMNLKVHPDKGGTDEATLWLKEWKSKHLEWFLGEGYQDWLE